MKNLKVSHNFQSTQKKKIHGITDLVEKKKWNETIPFNFNFIRHHTMTVSLYLTRCKSNDITRVPIKRKKEKKAPQRQKFIAVKKAQFRDTAISLNAKFRDEKSIFCGHMAVNI